MTRAIAAGIAAGIVCGTVLALVDCYVLVMESAGYWLRVGPTVLAVSLYLLGGALCGGACGALWWLVRRPSSDTLPLYRGTLIVLTTLGLVLFCWLYLYDFGWGDHRRGAAWHYVASIPLCLLVSWLVWGIARLLLALYGRSRRRVAWTTCTLLLGGMVKVAFMPLVGHGDPARPMGAVPANARNIVLLVLDTTRLDAVSFYGNPRRTTPHLDRIASSSVVYDRAYAPASWTAPSHASMFTGLYPADHGTYWNQALLLPNVPTVAEVLTEAGYETFFLSAKNVLRKGWGYDRGFTHSVTVNVEDKASFVYERLVEKFIRRVESMTPVTVDMAVEWLEQRNPARPFFLFINLNDSHTKYVRREPFFSECAAGIDLTMVDEDKVHHLAQSITTLAEYNEGKLSLNGPELEYLRCLYDSEAHFMDAYIGRLFEALQTSGQERGTVSFITSDHGEMLGEHDLMSHGEHLYDELIHVPLIVSGTGDSARVRELVSLVDLFPTFLDIAGLDPAQHAGAGASLLDPIADRTVFAENTAKGTARKALIHDDLKYVWESTGEQYLFDLATDPAERVNLIDTEPERARTFYEALSSVFDLTPGFADRDDIDEAVLKRLKSLGYLH